MTNSNEFNHAHRQKLVDLIAAAVEGTDVAPPAGGMLVDAVVIMSYLDTDGERGISWLGALTGAEMTEGMCRHVVRHIVNWKPGDD